MRAVLRRLAAEPAPSGATGPARRDLVLMGLLVMAAVAEAIWRPDLPWRVASLLLALALVPAMAWRRVQPLWCVAWVFGPVGVFEAIRVASGRITGADAESPGLYTMMFVLIIVYALTRWGSGRQILLAAPIMLAPAVLSPIDTASTAGEAVGGFIVLMFAAADGLVVRSRAQIRERDRDRIRATERERIARDLHDTVAHHVSAIAVSAQAGLATAGQQPENATAALRLIEQEASRALGEMRSIVRDLREAHDEGPVAMAPQAGLGQLQTLARAGGPGPEVVVHVDGYPDSVPSPVSTAAYRIVQEAVTNAGRHANGVSRIAVQVAIGDRVVRLRAVDDGRGAHPAPEGFGIAGMRERAALLGGWCTAGPTASGGWMVEAELPWGPGR